MNDRPEPRLILPEGLRYECIQCGRSCGEFWEIPVEPEMVESICSRPAEALAGAADPRDPVVASPDRAGGWMMRQTGGACCLLGVEGERRNLCTLHAAFGAEAKPNRCRSFPYRFIETPRGVHVGISFACTAVLGGEGPPMADQAEALGELFEQTTSRHRPAEAPGLAADLPLSWEQYHAVVDDLNELLEPELGPLEERLLSQSAYLGMLARFLREARGQAGALGAGAEANEPLLEPFRRRMRASIEYGGRELAWAIPRSLAARKRRSLLLRRVCLGVAHALRNTMARRRGRLASYVNLAGVYVGHALGRGSIELPGYAGAVDLKRLGAVEFDPRRREFDELLTGWFRHRLERQDLALVDDVRFGHQMMLLHWGLIHWYAAAGAAAAGRGEVTLEDLREALRAVEKFYVMHSRLERLFEDMPLLRGFIDALVARPLFAYSMARGEWWR